VYSACNGVVAAALKLGHGLWNFSGVREGAVVMWCDVVWGARFGSGWIDGGGMKRDEEIAWWV